MTKHTWPRLHLYVLDFTRMLSGMRSETGMSEADASELSDIGWHWEKVPDDIYEDVRFIAASLGVTGSD
jgi:hypothetical protein